MQNSDVLLVFVLLPSFQYAYRKLLVKRQFVVNRPIYFRDCSGCADHADSCNYLSVR